jgi:hypothetical protein
LYFADSASPLLKERGDDTSIFAKVHGVRQKKLIAGK